MAIARVEQRNQILNSENIERDLWGTHWGNHWTEHPRIMHGTLLSIYFLNTLTQLKKDSSRFRTYIQYDITAENHIWDDWWLNGNMHLKRSGSAGWRVSSVLLWSDMSQCSVFLHIITCLMACSLSRKILWENSS